MNVFEIRKSNHYKKYHESNVNWSLVIQTILTGKLKRKGKDILEYKSKSPKQEIYILCKKEGRVLKVINVKKRRK